MQRRSDDKIARIEQIHAALRESIAATKLLADEADGMLERGREPPMEEARPEPAPEPKPTMSG